MTLKEQIVNDIENFCFLSLMYSMNSNYSRRTLLKIITGGVFSIAALLFSRNRNSRKLKKMAKDLKIAKHVQFKGWVSETKKYFDTSKIFVMTSLYEGLPNVLIDAVNYEIPTISTKCSGATDILTKKEGVYFKLQDHNDLAKKMIKTASNYNNHLKKIRRTKMYLNRFLAEKQSTKYLDYCNKIF